MQDLRRSLASGTPDEAGEKAVMEEDDPVTRCPHCGLNQYRTHNGCCRRCSKPLTLPAYKFDLDRQPTNEMLALATKLVLCAHRGERSQRQMAKQLKCKRTYISKYENGHCTPSPMHIERFAVAFGIPTWRLVLEIECLARALGAIEDVALPQSLQL